MKEVINVFYQQINYIGGRQKINTNNFIFTILDTNRIIISVHLQR